MKVYYAHPMSLYSTKQEERDVTLLNQLGWEVVNPNSPEHLKNIGLLENKMTYFEDLVRNCDMLVFRAFPDGTIGSGVKKEIDIARGGNKFVLELPTGVEKRALSVEETKETLRESGQR